MVKDTLLKQTPIRSTKGNITRHAIAQLSAVVAKLVSEFKSEPCPESQAEVRPVLISLLEVTADVAVRDAETLIETLPGVAIAAFDRTISEFRVIEATEAVLDADDDGVKEKVISLVKLLLPLIPKKFQWVQKLIEVLLELIPLLQKDK